ncbi:MAG: DUF3545 family protein [Gammaproteobacteria bacterium]|nr:DUF3545 family protein [Gammaproteobacteria bacterium]
MDDACDDDMQAIDELEASDAWESEEPEVERSSRREPSIGARRGWREIERYRERQTLRRQLADDLLGETDAEADLRTLVDDVSDPLPAPGRDGI